MVVVTHGQLATELVNAAEMIVGDCRGFVAVSIGWHDDVETRAKPSRGDRAACAAGPACCVLTDMFGGTPSNLGLPFLGRAASR